MAKQELLLDGKVFDPYQPSNVQLQLKAFLDAAPPNEIYTSDTVKAQVHVGKNAIGDFARNPRYGSYVYRMASTKIAWFGSPSAIVLLRKKLAETNNGGV